jgi:hypothetical protein
MKRSRFYVALFCLLSCIGLLNFYCGDTIKTTKPIYLNHDTAVKYVGKQQCRSCHADIYNSFIKTGMGQSFGAATKQKSAANFLHDPLYDAALDFYYLPFWKGDSMYISEFRLQGKDTVFKRVERVDYIIGSGQHTNSHLTNINGYLFQMPMTWYAQKGKWDLPPGFENGRNVRFSRGIEVECMSCHNAMPTVEEGSVNKFVSIPDGIDCERCHGPGALHVQEKLKGIIVDTATQIDYTIVNPKKLPWELQIDVCQRCHLQGNAVLKEGKKFTDFRPGMVLSDYMEVYLPKYKDRGDEFIMASHAQRLQLSKCFIGSNQKSSANAGSQKGFETLELTCITCHNPHVSVKETGKQIFNNACLKCHSEKACKVDFQQQLLANNDCVSCHMPRSGSIDIPHVSVHDHKIAIPVAKKELSKIKVFEGLYCVNKANTSSLFKAAAYLNYFEKFDGEKSALDSANYFLKSISGNTSILVKIHRSYLQEDWNNIIRLVQTELKDINLITDAWTNYRVGQAYQNTGNFDKAMLYISRASELAKANLEFRNKKAILYIQKGDLSTANLLLEESLKLNPKQIEPWINLGFSYLQMGAIEKAFKCYENALTLDPDHPQALLNLAALYNLQGNKVMATTQLKKILKRNPNNLEVKSLLKTLS